MEGALFIDDIASCNLCRVINKDNANTNQNFIAASFTINRWPIFSTKVAFYLIVIIALILEKAHEACHVKRCAVNNCLVACGTSLNFWQLVYWQWPTHNGFSEIVYEIVLHWLPPLSSVFIIYFSNPWF